MQADPTSPTQPLPPNAAPPSAAQPSAAPLQAMTGPERRRDHRLSLLLLAVGLVAGTLFASMLFAQSKSKTPVPANGLAATAGVTAPFDIVDTPGSTYLLNRSTGQVWRLGFTEVKGDRYWFGTHVPVQQPGTFEEFQQGLRKRLGAGN